MNYQEIAPLRMPIIGHRFGAFNPLAGSQGFISTHPEMVLAATIVRITIQSLGYRGAVGGESGVAGRWPDSWRVGKLRSFGGSWCRPIARFWCIHDHLDVLAYLGLPTLITLLTSSLAMVGIWRSWDFPPEVDFLIAGLVCPFLGLFIFTALPLPCAVFAWKAAVGESASVGECFSWCRRRAGRLLSVFFRLGLLWLVSLVFLGLPLLWIWPRTCLTPLVALFEDDRRIFRRSRRILGEDFGVSLLGSLYLAMGIVLGGMIVLPRLLFGTSILGAHLVDARWRTVIVDNLWIFETISVATLLTAIAMGWWISLTLIYHDIRWVREGEDLKRRIALLRAKLAV